MTMDVLTAARNVGADYRGGVVALAHQIDKNPNSLGAELRGEGTAKLGLLDAVKMSVESSDYRILDAFNLSCGRVSLPLAEVAEADSKDCIKALANASKEFGDLCTEALQSITDDGKINDNERARIHKESGHLLRSVVALLAAVDANNAATKAGSVTHLKVA